MFYDDDIDTFLDTDEFAVNATYTERNEYSMVRSTSTLPVIFDSPGTVVTTGKVSYLVEKPQCRVKTASVPNLSNYDTFTINSTVYKVTHREDDGTGTTLVILAEDKR